MYVYIIKTTSHRPTKYYIGVTNNLKRRLQEHNRGKSRFTSAYRPWTYKNVIWFNNPIKAYAFERYLKTGSGRAFSNRHF